MNDDIVESLSEMLARPDSSTSFNSESIPRNLLGSRYIQKEFRAPELCPLDTCQARCEVVEEDGQSLLVRCDDGHEEETERSQHLYHNLDFNEILESVVDTLNREIDNYNDGALPRYVAGDTGDGLRIYLIVNPSEYENTINEICVDALADESPALLIAPDQRIKELLKRQALFASSNLIYSVPFSMVSEPEEIKHSLSTIQSIEDVEDQVLDEIESRDELVRRIDSNPRYILTELNHMRLLRIAGELPQSSGNRLERVAESAFSHLFATHRGSGGEDDRGKNVPDHLFFISDRFLPDDYDSILGVADSKSGKDAKFRDESVEGKHDEYIKEARDQSVAADKIAHTFVVLEFDGHQELDFFDRMSGVYQENEYMVIFTAEALAMLMSAYLSHTVSNELSLIRGSFQSVAYTLFDKERFGASELGLSDITRDVGRNQEEYDELYKQRSKLMIITPEVVKTLFTEYSDQPNEVERIFENYLSSRALV